ncbi:MAG: sigma-70 family RNA polymerase sigma factor, partial [Rhodoglobus sp.]
MSTQPATIHDLLVHADFLRRVVRDLVPDDATRADLTQEVWLQAMRSPPRESHGIRGWIATTARNLSANRRRSGARRAAREEFASHSEPSPDVAEILERESVRESVLRAVLELDEPFRGTVLLRYYEGLAPRDIAARLGIPDATVRTRLARGLERLRKRLDGEHGDRGAWVTAVLPLARPDAASDTVAMSVGLGPLAVGLALVVGGLATWVLSTAVDSELDAPGAVELVAVADAPQVDSADVLVTQAPSDVERSAVPETERPDAGPAMGRRAYAAERGRGAIHGVVLDVYDAPLAGVRVSARPYPGGLPPGFVVDEDRTPVADVTTDAAGRFRFEGVEEGPVRVAAVFADGRRMERGDRFHVLVVDARG